MSGCWVNGSPTRPIRTEGRAERKTFDESPQPPGKYRSAGRDAPGAGRRTRADRRIALPIAFASDIVSGVHGAAVLILDLALRALGPDQIIGGGSTCPRPDAVWAELATLVPRDRLDARLAALGAADEARPTAEIVQILDAGSSYRVEVTGRARAYADDARDCARRARVAAVFVALAIDPPELSPSPLAAAPLASSDATLARAAASAATRPARVRIEIGPAVSAGWGGESVTRAGASVAVAAGGGALAIVAGALVLAPGDTAAGDVRVHQLRVPFDLDVRATWTAADRLALFAEAGVVAAVVSARGMGLASDRSARAFEMGARGAVGLRLLPRAAFAPFVLACVELVPRPSDVFALPAGVVGHTPRLWIGAAAGVSWGIW